MALRARLYLPVENENEIYSQEAVDGMVGQEFTFDGECPAVVVEATRIEGGKAVSFVISYERSPK